MDAKMIEFMAKLEEQYHKLNSKLDALDKSEKRKLIMPESQECGEVVYTRLFKADEQLLEDMCIKTGRKRAQIMRVLVSDGLRRGVFDEGSK